MQIVSPIQMKTAGNKLKQVKMVKIAENVKTGQNMRKQENVFKREIILKKMCENR